MPGFLLLDLGTPDDLPPSARRSLRALRSDRRVIDIPPVTRRPPKGRGGWTRGEERTEDEGGHMPLRFAAAAGLVAALCALLPARAWG